MCISLQNCRQLGWRKWVVWYVFRGRDVVCICSIHVGQGIFSGACWLIYQLGGGPKLLVAFPGKCVCCVSCWWGHIAWQSMGIKGGKGCLCICTNQGRPKGKSSLYQGTYIWPWVCWVRCIGVASRWWCPPSVLWAHRGNWWDYHRQWFKCGWDLPFGGGDLQPLGLCDDAVLWDVRFKAHIFGVGCAEYAVPV